MSQYAATYCIRVRGLLGPEWSEWLEGLEVRPLTSGETDLAGPLPDQAALHGVLAKLRDMGLPLISVKQEEPL
jgi:hypothetical protein